MQGTLTPSAAEFVGRLRLKGFKLVADGSKLLVSPGSALTNSDRAVICERKTELLEWLTSPNGGDWRHNSRIPLDNEGTVAVATKSPLENDAPDSLPDWVFAAIDAAFPIVALGAKADAPDWLTRWNRPLTSWSGDDAELTNWFHSHRDSLPRKPFPLVSGRFVADPAKFYTALEGDIRSGANGPRAGGLIHDLCRLRQLFGVSWLRPSA